MSSTPLSRPAPLRVPIVGTVGDQAHLDLARPRGFVTLPAGSPVRPKP